MSNFQIGLLLVCAFFGLIAVGVFAGIVPVPGASEQQYGGEVTLWGTLPEAQVGQYFADFNSTNSDFFRLNYVQKNPATFEDQLISALASGKGPDLVLFPQDLLVSQADKLLPIPYSGLSERDFRDAYIDEAALYLGVRGAVALPLYVDPLVMYWNRDLLSSNGIAEPPKVWEQFPALPEKLTRRDARGTITQSAVALGGVRNVDWQKDILSTLIMQVGDRIVARNNEGEIQAVLGGGANDRSAAPAALRFYTEFANPSKTSYSWNSALPNSRTAFEAGILAIYFGHASEYKSIKQKNPHLNFDVALMPQRENSATKITFGRMYGLAVLKASKNAQTALTAAYVLAGADNSRALSLLVGLPSALRSVVGEKVQDLALDVFNRSAIISRGWLDPRPEQTNLVFQEMAESVIINKNTEEQAVIGAARRLDDLLD